MSEQKREELKVYYCTRETECNDCDVVIHKGELFHINGRAQHLCLSCADMDHLVYLPSGNHALSRRAKKYSKLSAVVSKFISSRKRNERQGILVENQALQKAQEECLSDEDRREKQREYNAKRRELQETQYIKDFAQRIRELYPHCPEGREFEIAEHACQKYSGRVGRSSSAKEMDEHAIRFAVVAHIRHVETNYDELLMAGCHKLDAREQVKDRIDRVMSEWE
ncbi:Uncharacterized conserved protein (DUF2293) [Desulfitobacterium hafniense]|uniref:Uncharacterized conserved protein (DUF2293) n=1 Tax=Desulfitobacterium hafniense TaxID=49338 RepID=A0A098B7R0_DESHA|nr:DUF2293 domain-containing protein [Desulfitobacterium hafniense]CDX04899.1 Uncharacterized conserved protein (DUF2293) [Desulfitobacterium hafniense]